MAEDFWRVTHIVKVCPNLCQYDYRKKARRSTESTADRTEELSRLFSLSGPSKPHQAVSFHRHHQPPAPRSSILVQTACITVSRVSYPKASRPSNLFDCLELSKCRGQVVSGLTLMQANTTSHDDDDDDEKT